MAVISARTSLIESGSCQIAAKMSGEPLGRISIMGVSPQRKDYTRGKVPAAKKVFTSVCCHQIPGEQRDHHDVGERDRHGPPPAELRLGQGQASESELSGNRKEQD